MPKRQPATFEAGSRPVNGRLAVAVGVAAVDEAGIVEKLGGYPLGILFPVGSRMEFAAGLQHPVYQVAKATVDDAALVVSFPSTRC